MQKLDGDDEAMKALVAQQPVVVAFSVTNNFMRYKNGIYVENGCPKQVNHAMVIISSFK